MSATGTDAGSFTYDAAGNQTADNRFASIYNQTNRLAEVQQGGVTVARYLYNSEGQRVAKTVGPTVTHFVYGQDGQLLGIYDGSDGSVVRGGEIFFIHTDHLGTPRVVSDGTQQILWRCPVSTSTRGPSVITTTSATMIQRLGDIFSQTQSGSRVA